MYSVPPGTDGDGILPGTAGAGTIHGTADGASASPGIPGTARGEDGMPDGTALDGLIPGTGAIPSHPSIPHTHITESAMSESAQAAE